MFNRILVPLDGSKLAESVMPTACYLSSQLHATLVLFHVVEKKAPEEIHGQHHLREVGEARTYLENLAEQLSCNGVFTEINVHEVQESGVAQTIRDHAVELHTDMVILCAHGSGGLRDMLFGSIAQQVIRQGAVPVLFIKPDSVSDIKETGIRRILLPLDGSPSHEESIPAALELAGKCGADIRLLTVIPTEDTSSVREQLTLRVSPRTAKLSLAAAERHAEEYLQTIGKQISDKGIKVSGLVLRGDPATLAAEAAVQEQADMVIMATHGHNIADARWEGSLTPRFLPKNTAPVLLVQGGEE